MKNFVTVYPDVIREIKQLWLDSKRGLSVIRIYFLIYLNASFLFFYSLFVLFILIYLGLSLTALILGNPFFWMGLLGVGIFIIILGMMLV